MIGFGQNVNIPDINFKRYLVGNTAINTNGDKEIQVSEPSAVKGEIDCSEMKISNLTGIEAFTALTELRYYSTQRSLDLSKNTALTSLWCGGNELTSLDVSKNTALTKLNCSDKKKLTSLDVSKNTALTFLMLYNNQLTSLDVSKNTALTELYCGTNQLTSLNVSKNTALTTLRCSSNQLTSLDLSKNTSLTDLICAFNEFDCEALKRKYGID